ncbi:MAG: DUF1349 domain-containing protein [Planctomycetota bacterium]
MLRLPLRPARFLAALCLPLLTAALARPQGAIVSDDFDTCGGLQSLWTLEDPLLDGTAQTQGVGSGQAHLHMTAPAGVEHQAWNSLYAPHVTQELGLGDFEVELKFEDSPAEGEIYGLLIKQNDSKWLRFDYYTSGGSTYVYAGRTHNGRTSNRGNWLMAGSGGALWLRVARSGNSYTLRTSADGSNWLTRTSFAYTFSPVAIGPYVGNFGAMPAATMDVDYVFDTANPIEPEDQSSPGLYPVQLAVTGSGQVQLNPPGGNYACGTNVTLTAVPDAGWAFQGWAGDLTGASNPQTITVFGPVDVQAQFLSGGSADPVISGVSIAPGTSTAAVQWTTDVPSDSQVDYGLTAGLGSTVFSPTFVTQHALLLSSLLPGSTYFLQISSTTPVGTRGQAGNLTLSTNPAGPAILSDDFNTCGGPSLWWTAQDTLSQAQFATTGMGTADAVLEIGLPAGSAFEANGALSVPYLGQPLVNGDFEIAARVQDLPLNDTGLGLLAIEDANHWVGLELYRSAGALRVTGRATNAGVSTTVFDLASTLSGSPFLQLRRTGNTFAFRASNDGVNWTTLGTTSAAHTGVEFGLYAASRGTLPGAQARFDFVQDSEDLLVVEDGPVGGQAAKTLTISPAPANGTIVVDPVLSGYSCGETVTVEAIPAPGYLFQGWGGDLSGSTNPTSLVMDQDRVISATFNLDLTPPVIANLTVVPGQTDAVVSWTTDVPASSRVDFGPDALYGSQVDTPDLVTNHTMLLSGLAVSSVYHFQVTSTGANGVTAQSADSTFTTLDPVQSVVASDDFNGCGGLGSAWVFQDSPAFDGSYSIEGVGTDDAQLWISVPSGVERQAYHTLNAPRVMQTVADTDFIVEAKFDSEVTQPYQIQGLIVEQDANNWVRFDVYMGASGVHYYAGSTVAGTTHYKGDAAVAFSAPYYLRVQRAGSQIVCSLSHDGASWTQVVSFFRSMVVNHVGPYAGNAFLNGNSPAFTAKVDYVFDTAAPIVPEDGPRGGAGPFAVTAGVQGQGSVAVNPVLSQYNCGDPVTLTATPAVGWLFSGWAGDANGSQNPLTLPVTQDLVIDAVFVADTGAPVITNLAVDPAATTATVTWDTIDPADSLVEFGPTPALGFVASSAVMTTSHAVVLTGLDPLTTYYYQVTSVDGESDATTSAVDSFMTLAAGSVTSDDFHTVNLNRNLWTFTDPAGSASVRMVGSGTADARVEISIPHNVVYEPYQTNGAARLSQEIEDEDFTFQVKFENPITAVNTSTGIYVEKDSDDWIRLDYYFDGTNLNVFSSRFTNGTPGSMGQKLVQSGPWADETPLYLRVTRVGTAWVTSYSLDGSVYTTVKSFSSNMVPARIGVMAGNSSLDPQAQTVVVDWFESTNLPILNEDPVPGPDTTAPFVYGVDAVSLSDSAVRIRWFTDEPSTGRVLWGTTAAYGQAPVLSTGSGYQHAVTLTGLAADTVYHFQVEGQDGLAQIATSNDGTVRTKGTADPAAPSIEFWYGDTDVATGAHRLHFGHLGNAQPQFNVLGRLHDDDQDRIALECTLEYRFNSGPWRAIAIGDDRTINYAPWRLANEGDFNVEVYVDELMGGPLVGGEHRNTLELRAIDNGGHETITATLIDYKPNVTWSTQTLTFDWAQIANGGTALEDVVQIVDGKWEIHNDPVLGHVLRPNPSNLGYDRLVAIGEGQGPNGWRNYEALLPVTVNSLDPQGYTTGTSSYAMGFLLRWTGHVKEGTYYPQPNHGLYPLGGLWIFRWFDLAERWELWINENQAILPQPGNDISLGVTYWYRVRCEDAPGGGTHYAFKTWPVGQVEPTPWTYEYTTNPGDPSMGSFLLVAHHSNSSFGNIVVTQLP